uniref:hypothetical protein n=1 Tax=Paractinoplanes polyasparticus TaxID=2856853 RepID=UPI001C849877|nr:hypothetical protein [Actinoplanes polyasparticus]
MAEATGLCVGGPLDGKRVTVTSPGGFIATDRANGLAWMYQRDSSGSFVLCLDHDNSLIYPEGRQTGERAIDWDRLPLSSDMLDEVKLGDTDEALSGDPVDDGWDKTKE